MTKEEIEKLYAYPTVQDFEQIVGFKVNEAFKSGWDMARTTNQMLEQIIQNSKKD